MIDLNKMYSGVEVARLAKIKSRSYISKYIDSGYLIAITTGKGEGKRYIIKGTWLKDFLDRYKKGLTNGKKYSPEEIKKILRETIENL
jgi:hypothetical protein